MAGIRAAVDQLRDKQCAQSAAATGGRSGKRRRWTNGCRAQKAIEKLLNHRTRPFREPVYPAGSKASAADPACHLL